MYHNDVQRHNIASIKKRIQYNNSWSYKKLRFFFPNVCHLLNFIDNSRYNCKYKNKIDKMLLKIDYVIRKLSILYIIYWKWDISKT